MTGNYRNGSPRKRNSGTAGGSPRQGNGADQNAAKMRLRRTGSGQTVADGLPNRAGRSAVNVSGRISRPRRKSARRVVTVIGLSALSLLLLLTIGITVLWNYVFSGFKPDTHNPLTVYPTEALTYSPPFDEDITNILLIGADASNTADKNYGLSDSLIILTVDSRNNVIKMTSIMRDSYTYIPGHKNPTKINAAHMLGGPELTVRTVNNVFRLNIEYYISVNMERMMNIIDIAGGVTIDVTEEEFKALDKVLFNPNKLTGPGVQKLNSIQAIQYARIRKIDSDSERTRRQRTVLISLFRMFKEASVVRKTQMIQQGLSQIKTNLTASQLTSLGMSVVPKMSNTVEQLKLPIDGYYKTNTHNGWYMVVDYNGLIPILYKFIYGQTHPFDPVPTIPFPANGDNSGSTDSGSVPASADSSLSGDSSASGVVSGNSSGVISGDPGLSPTEAPFATPTVTPDPQASSASESSAAVSSPDLISSASPTKP